VRVTQNDVVNRSVFNRKHRAFIEDFGPYITHEVKGNLKHVALSRQMVLLAVERRKSWRMLQSKAGIQNNDYLAQRELLKNVDAGETSVDDLFARPRELMAEALAAVNGS
jgi:pyruvate-ferredoxin/flavodoxin oxidoreductase